jgi:hypothetical protein
VVRLLTVEDGFDWLAARRRAEKNEKEKGRKNFFVRSSKRLFFVRY